jgi:hypothetical protein
MGGRRESARTAGGGTEMSGLEMMCEVGTAGLAMSGTAASVAIGCKCWSIETIGHENRSAKVKGDTTKSADERQTEASTAMQIGEVSKAAEERGQAAEERGKAAEEKGKAAKERGITAEEERGKTAEEERGKTAEEERGKTAEERGKTAEERGKTAEERGKTAEERSDDERHTTRTAFGARRESHEEARLPVAQLLRAAQRK